MNKQYLTIFQKYRVRKHARDLKKLQQDLSRRGLLNSGIGDEETQNLFDDFRDEIEMKKEEHAAEQVAEKNEKRERTFNRIINIITTVAVIFGVILSVWTFSETKKLNRPYLSIVQRNDILKIDNGDYHQILKVSIKNTGALPAKFKTNLFGWPCTSSPRRSYSDYIAPNQEIELGYNLFIGCKMPTDNLCDIYEDIKMEIVYEVPGQNNDPYITTFKMKHIPATKDMLHLNATSTDKYDSIILGCGGTDNRANLVSVWYVEQMK